jgi:hypothetical protein
MACAYPLTAYRDRRGPNPETGKTPLVFRPGHGDPGTSVSIPCGQCMQCRLNRCRQWAIRCVHEAMMWDHNQFVTLTYNQEHISRCLNGSLNKGDFVAFMKALRKECGNGIRFFHCGEYGDSGDRPHHHVCLFNLDLRDRTLWTIRQGVPLYRSATIEKCWTYGFSSVGNVTWDSAAYVSRYVTKKITGPAAQEHYGGRIPEYCTMSRACGIGRPYVEAFGGDIYPRDEVVIKGLTLKPPKYYDYLYDKIDHDDLERIKLERRNHIDPDTHRRRIVKEQSTIIKLNRKVRSYETQPVCDP